MPIHRDEASEERELEYEDTNHGDIFGFLKERHRQAYTRKEINNELDMPIGSVGPSLTRLKEEDMVEHKGKYWMIREEIHENMKDL